MNQKKVLNKSADLVPRISTNWIIIFLLWPFGALLRALSNFRNPHAKTVFWLFCVYFGFVFIYGDPNSVGGADSSRYAAQLIKVHNQEISFNNLVDMFYNTKKGITDIYQPLATWIIASFTADPRWLFTLFAAVFGFFYTQNLWLVVCRIDKNQKIGLLLFIMLVGYALVLPIWQINGVRMWTAAQVFIYGVLIYYLNDNKKGLIWAALSILFHFSFMLPVAILLIFKYLPKYITILTIFFFASTLFSEIDLHSIRENLSFLPEIFQYKVELYTKESYSESIVKEQGRLAWHVIYAVQAGKWMLYAWVFALYYYKEKWIHKLPKFNTLFCFALFLGGIAQIASNIPSGFRFMVITKMLFYATFIMALTQQAFVSKIKYLKLITIPVLGFYLIFLIRVGFEYMGLMTFFGNPLISFLFNDRTPLIEFVKYIF